MARDDPQMKLRLPIKLRAQVEEAAKKAGRSLNSEIITRLEETFERGADDTSMSFDVERFLANKVMAFSMQIIGTPGIGAKTLMAAANDIQSLNPRTFDREDLKKTLRIMIEVYSGVLNAEEDLPIKSE